MPPNTSDPSRSSPGDSAAPTGVGRTALMVAAARAAETRRADRLFADPYAADFIAAGGVVEIPTGDAAAPPGAPAPASSSFADYAPIRTRFFDDYLLEATRTIPQVVIVAAGLDTRAFRLGLSAEVTVYELDSAEVLDFKQRVLDERGAQPTSRRVTVATDLRGAWAKPLREAGFDPAAPSAWLIEGLLPYLTPGQNDELLATVTAHSATDSRLAVEFVRVDAVALLSRALTDTDDSAELRSLWENGGVDEAAEPWLRRHGWESRAYDTYERAHSYHRELPPPGNTPMDLFAAAAREGLVLAERSRTGSREPITRRSPG